MRGHQATLPIAITSEFNEEDMADRFIGRQIDGFLEKPFNPETLLSKVRAPLSRQADGATAWP